MKNDVTIPPSAPPSDQPAPPVFDKEKIELLKLQYTDSLERATYAWKQRVVADEEIRKAAEAAKEEVRKATAAADEEIRKATAAADQEIRKAPAAADQEIRKAAGAADEEIRKAAAAADQGRVDSLRKWEQDSVTDIEASYLEVIKGNLDRSIKRVELYAGFITAFITAYGALLALRFSAATVSITWVAIVPSALMGAGLALTGWYLVSFVRSVEDRAPLQSNYGNLAPRQRRLSTFADWVGDSIESEVWAIRLSVVSFAAGLVLAPYGVVASGGVTGGTIGALLVVGILTILGGLFALGKLKGPEIQRNLDGD